MNSIDQFMKSEAFAVAGASADRHKYGNKVLRCLIQNNHSVIPVNPRENQIEGIACVASILDLPDTIDSLSIITPPKVTEQVVQQAITKGIKNIWMQPGAESEAAIDLCKKNNINVIADGSCILVVLHYHDH